MQSNKLEKLLKTEDEQLQKLHAIVIKAIDEEKLLAKKLMEFEEPNPPLSSRIADRVATFGGSWKFILAFLLFMLCWIGVNLFALANSFDPYPFILLNLILSTVAALQAPIIMMSQNRKEEKDRQRSMNDYMVNLKAEVEIRHMHEKIDLLMAEQMKTLFELQKEQMTLMNDIKKMIKTNTISAH